MLSDLTRRGDFFGVPISLLTAAQAADCVAAAVAARRPLRIVALNTSKFVAVQSDPILLADLRAADMVIVDGAGILLVARLRGLPVPERVTGMDLLETLLGMAAERGWRPFLFGAGAAVLAEAERRARLRWPALQLAGTQHGHLPREALPEVAGRIAASGADLVFVGLPSPLKERIVVGWQAEMAAPVGLGVGGAFDVLSGRLARAPRWMRRAGLEWLFRLAQEPIRLGPRYLLGNLRYGWLLLCAALGRPPPSARGGRPAMRDPL